MAPRRTRTAVMLRGAPTTPRHRLSRRLRWAGAALAAILAALAAAAVAAPTPAPAETVLHLSETAERKVVRDWLRAELRVEENGADPLALQAAVNRRMAAALDRARQVQGIEVETGNYAVDEERPANGAARWQASQSLVLKSRAADALLKLAGTLQSDGLLISSLAYEVSPEALRGAEQDLTAQALAGLSQRAAAIAERLHLAVERYRDLRVGNAETGAGPMPRFAATAMAMAPPVAQPGEAMVRVTVSADILLGPPHR